MRVSAPKLYSPNFKAHFYEINPINSSFDIKTDNEKQLGEKPEFEYLETDGSLRKALGFEDKKGMHYGDFIWTKEDGQFKYKINYKDTGKVDDKNGDYHVLDYVKMYNKALEYNRKTNGLKDVLTLSLGKATGKLISPASKEEMKNIAKDAKTPYILLVKDFFTVNIPFMPSNIVGLISLGGNYETLSHESSNIKTRTDASAFIANEQMFENFEKHLGKFVELKTEKDSAEIKEIDKSQVHFNPKIQEIKIPKLKPVDKLLSTDEYTPDTVGAKALNLARLEKLQKSGKINAIIPPSFAIPFAYIEKMREENTKWQTKYKAEHEKFLNNNKFSYFDIVNLKGTLMLHHDEAKEDGRISEIMNKIEKTGIDGKDLMVRSAFNGEDLENYSAAGLYDSEKSQIEKEDIYYNIHSVAASKWNNRAAFSRKLHKISHQDIQPTVIIQQYQPCDYTFTAYTNDEDGKFRIEMFSKYTDNSRIFNVPVNPYIFTYDPMKDEFEIEQKENISQDVTFDENLNIINPPKANHSATDNFEKFKPVLDRIVRNAYAVQKEFNKPQDIEGGITFGDEENFKDDKLYFWQTRNIVYKNLDEKLKDAENEFLESTEKGISKEKLFEAYGKYSDAVHDYGKKQNYEVLVGDEIPNQILPKLYDLRKKESITQNDLKKIVDSINEKINLQKRFSKDLPAGTNQSVIDFKKTITTAIEDANTQGRKISFVNEEIADNYNQRYSLFYNYDAFNEVVKNSIETSPQGSEIEIGFETRNFKKYGMEYQQTFAIVKSLKDKSKTNIVEYTKNNLPRIECSFQNLDVKEDEKFLTVEFPFR